MANILRKAKSGYDWNSLDLAAYNIKIQFQDASTFFGVNPLPEPTVSNELLTKLDADDMESDINYKLLRYIHLAMSFTPDEESAVSDFAVYLLTVMGYVPRSRIARTRTDILLQVCGEYRYATPDACIIDPETQDILLLVQEDKIHKEAKKIVDAQLIAEAIAAFQASNQFRTHILGQEALESKIIPGITMVGTSPTFYKIPVTSELAEAVSLGQYPAKPTIVYAHLPSIPRPGERHSEGMKPLDNRECILSCYEAFKPFINWYALLNNSRIIEI